MTRLNSNDMQVLVLLRQSSTVPSYDEMAATLGRGRGSVRHSVYKLRDLGYVLKPPGKKYAITVTEKGKALNPEYAIAPGVRIVHHESRVFMMSRNSPES